MVQGQDGPVLLVGYKQKEEVANAGPEWEGRQRRGSVSIHLRNSLTGLLRSGKGKAAGHADPPGVKNKQLDGLSCCLGVKEIQGGQWLRGVMGTDERNGNSNLIKIGSG